MTFRVRTPTGQQAALCRMLLPNGCGPMRQILLAETDVPPYVAGAASWMRLESSFEDLQVHVVPPLRRRGVGRGLVDECVVLAERSGAGSIAGTIVGTESTESVAAFAGAMGFQPCGEALTRVECDLDAAYDRFPWLRSAGVRLPGDYKVAKLQASDRVAAAKLIAEHIASIGEIHPVSFLAAQLSAGVFNRSPVLVQEDRVVGVLLIRREGNAGAIAAEVVAPHLRKTAAIASLLADACEEARAQGVQRFRFEYGSSVPQTAQIAEKLGAAVIDRIQPVIRRLSQPGAVRPGAATSGVCP